MSNSLQPHRLQHARPSCPSPTPRAYSNSMSIESVMPFNHLIFCHPLLLLPLTFPSIKVFPMSQFFTSGGQSIRASASASVFPMNIQDLFLRFDWFDLLAVQGALKSLSSTTVQKHQFFGVQLSLWSNSYLHT